MLTDADIDRLEARFEKKFMVKDDLKNFATKDDLKSFATKEDLKNFVTKDDLKSFATKEDLNRFATKDDLDGMEIRFKSKFASKEDLKGMEQRFESKFATKDGLKEIEARMNSRFNAIELLIKKLDIKFDLRIDQLEARFLPIEEWSTEFTHSVLESLEWLARAYLRFDHENVKLTRYYIDLRDKVERLEHKVH